MDWKNEGGKYWLKGGERSRHHMTRIDGGFVAANNPIRIKPKALDKSGAFSFRVRN
jgi:hypothetical protein